MTLHGVRTRVSRMGATRRRDRSHRAPVHKRKRPTFLRWGVLYRALAMTYFLTGNPQYHRRGVVSRSCSGWEGVGPTRYGRQEFWKKVVTWLCIASWVSLGSPPTR